MNERDKQKIVHRIVLERIKSMSPNVRITLGSKTGFLNKDSLLKEVKANTNIGKKIIEIQLRYMRALKEGVI